MADGGDFRVPWRYRRRVELVLQTESAECGLACIAMIAAYHGNNAGLASLRRRFGGSLKGMALNRLVDIADDIGFDCRALRAELEYLRYVRSPVILHWDMNHFVVLAEAKGDQLVVYDPAKGRRVMPIAEVGKHFTGILLELSPTASFKQEERPKRIRLQQLTGRLVGLKRSLVQVLGLALAIEVLGLLVPLQAQWTVDQFSSGVDSALLMVVTAAFGLIICIQAGLSVARGWLLSWVGANMNSQWQVNIFSHLMRLPMDFFERRHLGDVLSKIGSVHAVQSTLTSSFVTAMLDGLTGILALLLLAMYQLKFAGLVLVVVGLYALVRRLLFQKLWTLSEDAVVFQARQQTEMIESLRGMQAIKLANAQAERKARIANAVIGVANKELGVERVRIIFSGFSHCLFGLQRVALLGYGAYMMGTGAISAGMLVAVLAYADQFSSRAGSLIDKVVELGMLKLHLGRIADIATSEPVQKISHSGIGDEWAATIELKGCSYRYSDGEPWVFHRLDLAIAEGESVAIVGPSGCGKTTLAKVILGLATPQEGELWIGGAKRSSATPAPPGLVAAVMQDDCLFSGSIADNIAFFDAQARLEAICQAAVLAGIHKEILMMPMGYETMVGDMGSALSGGQKQRILLARALYMKPKILVLDEATSHLDTANESIANAAVKALNITRVIIAHRAETIACADRVFDLSKTVFIR
ncbi:MAG: peptidase domain-containing ABC transporter [Stenotrophomonas sp.]